MSFQVQPQQQPQQPQQQPVQVYPNIATNQPAASYHSNGSFGTVFVVLSVIIVISAIACFLGRLCNRRYNKPSHSHNQKPIKQQKQNHPVRPKVADIEFGFDKRVAASKPNGHGGSRGPKPPPPATGGNGGSRGPKPVPPATGGNGGSRGPKPPPPATGGNGLKTFEIKFGD